MPRITAFSVCRSYSATVITIIVHRKSDLVKILKSSESKGFVGITYYDGGARSFYSNKPITKPEDLAGMKIRVQQSPSAIAIAMMKALGGVATRWRRRTLHRTSSKGVVDGGENNTVVYSDMRHAGSRKSLFT